MFDVSGDRRRRIARTRGRSAVAQVLEIRETRTYRNREPELAVRLAVAVDGRPPWEAETRVAPRAIERGGVRPGAVFRCWVHPSDPRVVSLDAPGEHVAGPPWQRFLEALLFWI